MRFERLAGYHSGVRPYSCALRRVQADGRVKAGYLRAREFYIAGDEFVDPVRPRISRFVRKLRLRFTLARVGPPKFKRMC